MGKIWIGSTDRQLPQNWKLRSKDQSFAVAIFSKVQYLPGEDISKQYEDGQSARDDKDDAVQGREPQRTVQFICPVLTIGSLHGGQYFGGCGRRRWRQCCSQRCCSADIEWCVGNWFLINRNFGFPTCHVDAAGADDSAAASAAAGVVVRRLLGGHCICRICRHCSCCCLRFFCDVSS